MAFSTVYDVANRAIQHLGMRRITNFSDSSKEANEFSFIHEKVRQAELRRAVWTFATRRMVMRPSVALTARISFPTYSAATAYTAGDIVYYLGVLYINVVAVTGGTVPGLESVNPNWQVYFGPGYANAWLTATNYLPGDVVYNTGTLTVLYICVAPHASVSPTNNPPNATYWHVIQAATAAVPTLYYPEGYEKDGTTVRTKFFLPSSFMRLAAQDPKKPATSHLPVSAGLQWNDWELEDGRLFSSDQTSMFVMRFVADTSDVSRMDSMFCEAWALHMALHLCETFTQSKDDKVALQGRYEQAIATARAMSAIEAGSSEEDFAQRTAPPQPQGQ